MNNRLHTEQHTKTGNQEKVSCFLHSFFAFSKIASIMPYKGDKKNFSPIWQNRKLSVEGGRKEISANHRQF